MKLVSSMFVFSCVASGAAALNLHAQGPMPSAPCPFGGDGDGKAASKAEANNFFDGFGKAYDKVHGVKADEAKESSHASAEPPQASMGAETTTLPPANFPPVPGFVQRGVTMSARLQSWIQRRIQSDDAPTMAKLIFSASTQKVSAAQLAVRHGQSSPEETLMPIGQGAYQSADAVAQRTTDSRKHCEDAVIYKSANWQDCFKDAGDYIDGPSHGYASHPTRSAAAPIASPCVGLGLASAVAATLMLIL